MADGTNDEYDDDRDDNLRKSWSSTVRTISPLFMFKELASSSCDT